MKRKLENLSKSPSLGINAKMLKDIAPEVASLGGSWCDGRGKGLGGMENFTSLG